MVKSLFAWALFSLYNALVFFAALIPGSDIPSAVYFFNDKQLHALQYFILFLVTVYAFGYLPAGRVRRFRSLAAVLWGLAVGALTEILQNGIPGRSAEMLDWLADGAGVFVGYFVWLVWTRKRFSGTKKESYGNL